MPPRLPATDRCRSTRGYTLAHAPQHRRTTRHRRNVLPDQAARWLRVEAVARNLAERYAFERVDTPLFERIELFARSAGKSSDLVEKEMFRVSGATGSDEERAEWALRPSPPRASCAPSSSTACTCVPARCASG